MDKKWWYKQRKQLSTPQSTLAWWEKLVLALMILGSFALIASFIR